MHTVGVSDDHRSQRSQECSRSGGSARARSPLADRMTGTVLVLRRTERHGPTVVLRSVYLALDHNQVKTIAAAYTNNASAKVFNLFVAGVFTSAQGPSRPSCITRSCRPTPL